MKGFYRLTGSKVKLSAVVLMVFFVSAVSQAQIPNRFHNLKVLPDLISKDELLHVMRGFTSSLGVRCLFCHKGDESTPFNKIDFASDEKPNKDKARLMMKMVKNINENYLAKISKISGDKDNDFIKVKCVTCHHGQPEPQTLEAVLMETINKEGVDQAIEKYHKLRDRFYGGFSYDFQDHTLVKLSEELIDAKKPDAAVAMSKLNLEMYPESGVAFYGMAQSYEANNDKQNAIIYYKKALEKMPNNDRIAKKLEELQN